MIAALRTSKFPIWFEKYMRTEYGHKHFDEYDGPGCEMSSGFYCVGRMRVACRERKGRYTVDVIGPSGSRLFQTEDRKQAEDIAKRVISHAFSK